MASQQQQEELTEPFSSSGIWRRHLEQGGQENPQDEAAPGQAIEEQGEAGTESTRPFTSPGVYERFLANHNAEAAAASEPGADPEGSLDQEQAVTSTEVASTLPLLLRNLSVYENSSSRIAFRSPTEASESAPSNALLQDGNIVCVEQNTREVNWTLSWTTKRGNMAIAVYYDPGRDDCVLLNACHCDIVLSLVDISDGHTNSEDSMPVPKRGQAIVAKGLWRIHEALETGHDSNASHPEHALEFLILRRKFSVHTSSLKKVLLPAEGQAGQPGSSKRKASIAGDDNEPAGSVAKRAKAAAPQITDDVTDVYLAVPKVEEGERKGKGKEKDETKGEGEAKDKDEPRLGLTFRHKPSPTPISPSRQITETGTNPMLELLDGDTAIVRNTHALEEEAAAAPANYALTRVKWIAGTRAVSVFSADHSGVSSRVVAKVVRTTQNSLVSYARTFSREVRFLLSCNHPNIVKLHAFDSRFFTILPLNLAQYPTPYAPQDARLVLHDVCAGLAYLANRGLAHGDIKPANIAFSRERGAVLLDFGMVGDARESAHAGGTPFYVPPEYAEPPYERGLPGDIWATGITMLFVLNKIRLPERSERHWHIGNVPKRGDDWKIMSAWLNKIAVMRNTLDRRADTGALVHKMLSRHNRITAGEVISDLEMDL